MVTLRWKIQKSVLWINMNLKMDSFQNQNAKRGFEYISDLHFNLQDEEEDINTLFWYN